MYRPPFSRSSPCHCFVRPAGANRRTRRTPRPAISRRSAQIASMVLPIPTSSHSKRPSGQALAVSSTTRRWWGHRSTKVVASQVAAPFGRYGDSVTNRSSIAAFCRARVVPGSATGGSSGAYSISLARIASGSGRVWTVGWLSVQSFSNSAQ